MASFDSSCSDYSCPELYYDMEAWLQLEYCQNKSLINLLQIELWIKDIKYLEEDLVLETLVR